MQPMLQSGCRWDIREELHLCCSLAAGTRWKNFTQSLLQSGCRDIGGKLVFNTTSSSLAAGTREKRHRFSLRPLPSLVAGACRGRRSTLETGYKDARERSVWSKLLIDLYTVCQLLPLPLPCLFSSLSHTANSAAVKMVSCQQRQIYVLRTNFIQRQYAPQSAAANRL